MLTWLYLPLWSSATRSPTLNPWNLWWLIVGAGSLHSWAEDRGQGHNCCSLLSFSCPEDGSLVLSGTVFSVSQRRAPAVVSHLQSQCLQEKKLTCPCEPWHSLLSGLVMGSNFRVSRSSSHGERHADFSDFASRPLDKRPPNGFQWI